jgi:hypothetical protein
LSRPLETGVGRELSAVSVLHKKTGIRGKFKTAVDLSKAGLRTRGFYDLAKAGAG